MNIKQIINEEIAEIIEGSYDGVGVGDKYFEKVTSRRTDGDLQNVLGRIQADKEKPFKIIGNTNAYKNPKSLSNFDSDVRAIADINGDLYILQHNTNIMHGEMGYKLGLVNQWGEIYNKPNEFVLLHRLKKTNDFLLSDMSCDELEHYEIHFQPILQNVKETNPKYDFHLECFDA